MNFKMWHEICSRKSSCGYCYSTCKLTHVKISFFCALRLHGSCIMSPVQTLCTVHAVHRRCFQTCLIRSRRRFLDPVIFSLILCGYFDVLKYLQTAHTERPHFLLPWHFFKRRAVWETESVKSTWQHVYSCICVQRSLLCVSFNSAIVL